MDLRVFDLRLLVRLYDMPDLLLLAITMDHRLDLVQRDLLDRFLYDLAFVDTFPLYAARMARRREDLTIHRRVHTGLIEITPVLHRGTFVHNMLLVIVMMRMIVVVILQLLAMKMALFMRMNVFVLMSTVLDFAMMNMALLEFTFRKNVTVFRMVVHAGR